MSDPKQAGSRLYQLQGATDGGNNSGQTSKSPKFGLKAVERNLGDLDV